MSHEHQTPLTPESRGRPTPPGAGASTGESASEAHACECVSTPTVLPSPTGSAAHAPTSNKVIAGSSADWLLLSTSLDRAVQAWANSAGVLWSQQRLEAGTWTTLIDNTLRMQLLARGPVQIFPTAPAWHLDLDGPVPRIEPLEAPPGRAPTVLVPAGRTMVTIKAALDWYRRGVARCWLHEPTGWEILDLEPLLCELMYVRRVRPILRKAFPALVLDEAGIVAGMANRLRIRRRRRFGLHYAGANLPDLMSSTQAQPRGQAPRRAFGSTQGRQVAFAPAGPELWSREIAADNQALAAWEAAGASGGAEGGGTMAGCPDLRLLTALPTAHEPLRVLHYIGSLNSGGAERQLCNLAIGLHERGHHVRVRSAYELVGELGHYLPLLENAGVDATHASIDRARTASIGPALTSGGSAGPATTTPRGLRWDLLAAAPDNVRSLVANLACELLAFRPHVLHAWLDHPNMIAGMAGLIAGVPRILFSTRNSNPTNFPRLHSPELDTWYRVLTPSRRIHWLANSHSGAASYAEYAGVPVERIHVVLNGVFRDHFTPPTPEARAAARAKFELPPDVPVVAIINRLSEEKQPEIALKVISMVRADVPNVRVLFAGAGPLEDRVREVISQRGLENCVRMLGRVRDVDSILIAADCLLLTSTLEGCPNVALEAQHVGTPVVATRGGGTIDAVVDGRTGFLCGVTDAVELTLALRRVLTDAELRRQFGRQAQRFVDASFGIDQMVDLTRQVYDVMLAARCDAANYLRVVTPRPDLSEEPATMPTPGSGSEHDPKAANGARPAVASQPLADDDLNAAAEPMETSASVNGRRELPLVQVVQVRPRSEETVAAGGDAPGRS